VVKCLLNIKKNISKANHDPQNSNSSNIVNKKTNNSNNITNQKVPTLNKGKSLEKLYYRYRSAQYRKHNRLIDDEQNKSYIDVTRSKLKNRSKGYSITRKNNHSTENVQNSNSSLKNKKKNITISTNFTLIDNSIHNPNSFQKRMKNKMDLIFNKLELMKLVLIDYKVELQI
jgi:hypothetical protein